MIQGRRDKLLAGTALPAPGTLRVTKPEHPAAPAPTVISGTKETFLTAKELGARWGCSVKSLSNNRSLRQGTDLPFIRLGRLVRYRLSDVTAFEAKGRVGE
jgi:hypothetical protein